MASKKQSACHGDSLPSNRLDGHGLAGGGFGGDWAGSSVGPAVARLVRAATNSASPAPGRWRVVSGSAPLGLAPLGLALAMFSAPLEAGGEYVLGQPRVDQQGNFCDTVPAALAVAEVFRQFGARPGFAALSQSADCGIRVASFTPLRLLTRIELGDAEHYWMRFVVVELPGGDESVLVTTRAVRHP